MSVLERQLKNNLTLAKYYYENRNTDVTFKEKSISIIKKAYEPFSSCLVQTLNNNASDSIVELAEVAFQCGLEEIASNLVNIYFELDNSIGVNKNNFYIRGLLVKAQVNAEKIRKENLKAEAAIEVLLESVKSIQKGIELIAKPENKEKYFSIVYNASIITTNVLKNYLKNNWANKFWEIIEKISNLLEEGDDMDFNWRIFILIKLAECYIDADKKAEGTKALDKIGEILKKKGDCDFMDELYRIRIHLNRDNSGALGNIKKEGETNTAYPQFKYIYTIQAIKSNIITDKDIDKEVNTLITAICPDFYKNIDQKTNKYNNTNIIKLESWKSDVLAELAFEILKFPSMISTSYNLYSLLNSSGINSLKGKIFLENIKAQKLLYDLEENLKENVQPVDIINEKRIKARAEALNILEKNLAGCIRLQNYDLLNQSAMIIFNMSMPFFKKSFRKFFQKAFYRCAEQLELINSNESFLRAALHFELSKYYLDEDLLQEANQNIIKALSNDYSIPINKLTFDSNNQGGAQKGAKAPKGGNANVKSDDPNLINSTTNNVSYHQRNLEQYLIYLKRYVGVKIAVYNDPDNIIDKLIFETDNLRNSKNPETQKETIKKCMQLIRSFELEEFKLPKVDKDLVEEEIKILQMQHDLKIYDDKKHFINICNEISKYCYQYEQYEEVLEIDKLITDKFLSELDVQKDIDQLISISEIKINVAECYKEYLLGEGIELYSNNYENIYESNKQYTEEEKEKINDWRNKLYETLKESNRIASSVNQPWLIFNVAIKFWNQLTSVINNEKWLPLLNENLFPLFEGLFDSMNKSMIYYEATNAELTNTDYYKNVKLFSDLTKIYCKFLDYTEKIDDCIKICDIMLSRQLEEKFRKEFDTIKAHAQTAHGSGDAGAGKKKAAAPAKAPPVKGKSSEGGFNPTPEMNLISDCFSMLENAVNIKEEKEKCDLLKKGVEQLNNFKVNFHDENSIELYSELWYKYGVQFFNINEIKQALNCADHSVKTYNNPEVQTIYAVNNRDISLTLKKWYCLGFLLYGDCLLKLVDKEKQERLSQIKLYFSAIEKIISSAKIAEKAKQYYVILQDCKAFYSVVINVIDQPQNRVKLVDIFLQLHNILIHNKVGGSILYSDPEFLLLFFSLFCICINETQNWELGENVINEAIKIIPNQYNHILLENKLFYYAKQGKNFLQTMGGDSGSNSAGGPGGDKDILTKAKLFQKLARSSLNKLDQYNAYQRAITMLKNDQNVYVCNVIFELASWLYKNNYPYTDIEDNLNQAADILLEIEPIFEEDDALIDDGRSLTSRRSSSSRSSRLSKKSKSRRSTSKVSKNKSTTSRGRSKVSERTKRTGITRQTQRTKTVFAKILDYDPYPLYMNIQHLEHLFKIQIFLAIVAPNFEKKMNYLLDGFYILRKIIEISLTTMNVIDFFEKNKEEIEKMNFIGNDLNPLSSLISHYYIEKDIKIPQVYKLPESLEEWLIFDWDENFLNRIAKENEINKNQNATLENANISIPNYTFFCQKSFETPYQFFYYYLYMLDKFENDYYFHSECLMAIKFGQLFAKYILEDKNIEFALSLKYNRIIHNICIHNEENDVSKLLYENINESTKDKIILDKLTKQKMRDELKQFSLELNDKTESFFAPTGVENTDVIIRYTDNLKSHEAWIELSKEYYKFGYFNYAKDFSLETKFHSLVLKDKDIFMESNLLLANIHFIESDFDSSCKLFMKIQNLNQCPNILFKVVQNMTNIFDYMGKHEEMIHYLECLLNYLDNIYDVEIKAKTYKSNITIFYQIYTFSLINIIRAYIKKYSENIKANEYNIIKEQKLNMNQTLDFFKTKIFPKLNKFIEVTKESSYNILNILNLYDFIELSLDCLIKNNTFVFVSKEELNVICEIFQKCLNILEESSKYLNKLQTYVPLRIDNSIIYMPIHRVIAYGKILYSKINNLIGEFKSRIKRESYQSQKLSLNDKDINTKFKEGVKYNQEVIDYLNNLTVKINEMNIIDQRDNLENLNRYEKSISLLNSCESLIPKVSSEYLIYFIEKINSFRLQSNHMNELSEIWDEVIIEKIKDLINIPTNLEEAKNNEEEEPKKEGIKIGHFHQTVINIITQFEKDIKHNEKNAFDDIIKENPLPMSKYYFNVLETTGYLNIELSFKSLCDFQNYFVKNYFNKEVINRYVASEISDWSLFSEYHSALREFSFNSQFERIYHSMELPKSISDYKKAVNDIPYYKAANSDFYDSWEEVKELLPNNSSYFIIQMNEDKSILYLGLMTLIEKEAKYYIKRILLNRKANEIIDNMIQVIKTMKHTLVKTVIVTTQELEKLFNAQNEKINNIIKDLENNIDPAITSAFKEFNNIINPEIKEEEDLDNKKDKKGGAKKVDKAPAAGKKGKVENLDIILPTSGIEQITFLVDYRLYDLPFESISIFNKIPYKSNDFSLNTNIMRLKNINYNPTQNANGISLPGNVKYYLDYHSEQKIKYDLIKILTDNLNTGSGGAKKGADQLTVPLEGVLSTEHKPSIAELQKLYMNSNIFIFTSQTAFLYQFPYDIFNTSRYSKCKIAFIIDRIANIKNFVDQNSLIPKTFNFNYQPIDTIAMMTLCGVVSILTTKWSIDYNEASEIINDVIEESVNKNDYISHALNKYKEPKRIKIEKEINELENQNKENKKDDKKKIDPKKPGKNEPDVLDETNSVEVNKINVFKFAPILFGLNNVKIV